MRGFDKACLTDVEPLPPTAIKRIRDQAGMSQTVFALTLIVTPSLGSRWERGEKKPVAAAFENGRAKLAGRFPELEDELAGLILGGGYEGPGRSPDRADAAVWAMTELLKPAAAEPRVRSL